MPIASGCQKRRILKAITEFSDRIIDYYRVCR